MADWREPILRELTPGVAPLTLAADPDGLLLEEKLSGAIRDRGFELITFEDHGDFRFAYESRFRSQWDQGAAVDCEIIVRAERVDLAALPHDLLMAGRRLAFGLGALFPRLSYPVVAALNRGDLDALYSAQEQHAPRRLGADDTADFALLHVFDLAPKLAGNAHELLRLLLQCHYRGQLLPPLLEARLVRLLRQGHAFDDWPLEAIVPNRATFLAFLQERWPRFIDRFAKRAGHTVREDGGEFGLTIDGPPDLPFDHDDVRVYIDNLFVDGMLRPVRHEAGSALHGEWVAVGIGNARRADGSRRFTALLDALEATVSDAEARHQDWTAYAWRWAQLGVLQPESSGAGPRENGARIDRLRAKMEPAFLAWMQGRYAGLHNQPPDPPAMVHHVPRYLARRVSEASGSKVALLVVDGLALDQWIVLRDTLAIQRPRLRFRERAVFAWAPTITSVSRQAIFAGQPPLYFPSSVLTTDREPASWTRFWMDHGLQDHQAGYAKGLGDGLVDGDEELLQRPGLRALGLVVNTVDKIMHGMQLGAAGMRNQVRQWAEEGFMAGLLDALLDAGFAVVLTSDHGNIEAVGCGRPSEGAIADVRGERARIYSDPTLRDSVAERFPGAVAWPAVGLPPDFLALLAPGCSAFVVKGKRIVGHGGIALEEVIVPLVEIERRPI